MCFADGCFDGGKNISTVRPSTFSRSIPVGIVAGCLLLLLIFLLLGKSWLRDMPAHREEAMLVSLAASTLTGLAHAKELAGSGKADRGQSEFFHGVLHALHGHRAHSSFVDGTTLGKPGILTIRTSTVCPSPPCPFGARPFVASGHKARDRLPISNRASPNDANAATAMHLDVDAPSGAVIDRKSMKGTEELQREVLKAISHSFGPEHPDTLASKTNLAMILLARKDLTSAEQLQKEVLEARIRTLGPDHPDTLGSMKSLATLLLCRGDAHAAEKLQAKLLSSIRNSLDKQRGVAEHLPPQEHVQAHDPIEPLSAQIVDLNKVLINSVKGVIDAMYRGRDIQRFFVLETFARVPYFAYVSCLHLFESLGQRGNTQRLRLHYAEADNELHHLLIMEELGGANAYVDRVVAQHLAFFYYWYCVAVYMMHPRAAYHLSELIEEHAYHTYDAFMEAQADELRKRPVPEIARQYYGGRDLLEVYLREGSNQSHRKLDSLYDVFAQVRDDEGAHWRTLHNLVQHNTLHDPESSDSHSSAVRR
eukprot:gnl/TRDRNA2_/TRDRNA2_145023_c0_seq5.p1 gnl/TRDRNA2_/TRDRNA2_145023_c0~~gnl/TRDRNA2_/TRDRNA2_145023_c0_seq5.p1  ORF type:complete len:536 (+),score=83.25 gnl/TRDRNA2_/TRDRNA2_145023_c0_seq5:160-1767(+)